MPLETFASGQALEMISKEPDMVGWTTFMWDVDAVKFCSLDRLGELASPLYDHHVYCFLQIRRTRVYGRSKEGIGELHWIPC